MSTAKYTKLSVTEQPQASAWTPEPKEGGLQALKEYTLQRGATNGASVHGSTCSCNEKQEHLDQQDGLTQHSDHRRCHNGRLRRFLVPAVAFSLFLMALLAVGCMSMGGDAGWGVSDLVSRAVTDGTTSTSNSPFVHRKLYLIVVFVGLLVVVILAVMLSAWCCRGAFENPLCCPCYLCACCGGLACLECIGCGLCAEGIDQM